MLGCEFDSVSTPAPKFLVVVGPSHIRFTRIKKKKEKENMKFCFSVHFFLVNL